MTCEWYITVRPGRTIGLQFSEFHIRNSDTDICKNYILVRIFIFHLKLKFSNIKLIMIIFQLPT